MVVLVGGGGEQETPHRGRGINLSSSTCCVSGSRAPAARVIRFPCNFIKPASGQTLALPTGQQQRAHMCVRSGSGCASTLTEDTAAFVCRSRTLGFQVGPLVRNNMLVVANAVQMRRDSKSYVIAIMNTI